MKYPRITDGQWVNPVRRGYRWICCRCELKHKLDFKLVKRGKVREIEFRGTRA